MRPLVTKHRIPLLRPDLVSRPRLLDQLEAGRTRQQPLTLISASAGFGKTTLVLDWLKQINAAAWLSLDEEDNDPFRFFRLLIAALHDILPGVGATAQELLSFP